MSTTPSQQQNSTPASSKKPLLYKVLAVVVVGHLITLGAISQMKTPELRPLEPKKPVNVKFVKIKKEAPPPPPKPKPKPEPKKKDVPKEVKIVEKPKPQPKPVTPPPKVVATPTPSPRPQITVPPSDPVPNWKPAPVQAPTPTPPKVVVPPAPPTPTAPPAPPTPVMLSQGELVWRNKPAPNPQQLGNYFKKDSPDRVVVKIRLTSNASGKIIHAEVVKSSGIPNLDNYILGRVKAARLSEYKPNGATAVIDFAINKPANK